VTATAHHAHWFQPSFDGGAQLAMDQMAKNERTMGVSHSTARTANAMPGRATQWWLDSIS